MLKNRFGSVQYIVIKSNIKKHGFIVFQMNCFIKQFWHFVVVPPFGWNLKNYLYTVLISKIRFYPVKTQIQFLLLSGGQSSLTVLCLGSEFLLGIGNLSSMFYKLYNTNWPLNTIFYA